MKIAVFGWYGHDNAGDERIKYCLNKFLIGLGGIERIDFYDLHENAIKGKTNKFDYYDLVIVGGGGLILSYHNYHDFILGISTKVITIGVSVETELKGNTQKFAKALLEKSLVFLVRDHGSYEKLFSLDVAKKVQVSADLTFLEPYVPLDIQSEKRIGMNLLAKFSNCNYSKVTFSILSLLNKIGINYYPKTICFQRMIRNLNTSFDLCPIPLYCAPQDVSVPDYQMNDTNFMKKYFNNVSIDFNEQLIDSCQLFISMRLHGLIFAVQKGVLPITFSIYPKQINFMREVGLGKAVVGIDELDKVGDIIAYFIQHEKEIKQQILVFREKSEKLVKLDMISALNVVFNANQKA